LAVALFVSGCAKDRGHDPSELIVISCTPARYQTNVDPTSQVILRFSEPVDHRSVLGTNQIILVDQANSLLPVSFTFQGELVVITPGSPFGPNATYGVAVRPGVRDMYGNNIETPFEATFATGTVVATIPNWPPFAVGGTPPVPVGTPGTWTPVGGLTQARAWHTANRLHSGEVIVIGGTAAAGFSRVLRSAELYDPTTRSWRYSLSLNNGMYYCRAGHTATLLQSGKILVAGGTPDRRMIYNNAEIYDPLTDSFTVTPHPMNQDRAFHTGTLLPNGNVLITGGGQLLNNPLTILSDTMEVYDVGSGMFHLVGVTMLPLTIFRAIPGQPIMAGLIPLGRAHHTANLLPDNTVLIAGGYTGPFINWPFSTANAQIYSPDLSGIGINGNIRQTATPMASSRVLHTATGTTTGESAGLVFFFGGFTNSPFTGTLMSGEVFDYLEVAQSGSNMGQKGCFTMLAANMHAPRRNHTATFIPGGLVYDPNTSTSYTSNSGLVLIVGGTQNGAYIDIPQTPPYPELWIEIGGCGCSANPDSELLDPWAFGKNPSLPFRGTPNSGFCYWTADQNGTISVIPHAFVGLWYHTATMLLDGTVLIAGGKDCPFCIPAPFIWAANGGCAVYNP
jgi:hypothetical protein